MEEGGRVTVCRINPVMAGVKGHTPAGTEGRVPHRPPGGSPECQVTLHHGQRGKVTKMRGNRLVGYYGYTHRC